MWKKTLTDTPHSVFPARWEGDIDRIKFWPTRKDITVQQRLSSCEYNCANFLRLHSSCKRLQHGLIPSGSYSSFSSTAYSPQRSPAPADIVWPTQLLSNTASVQRILCPLIWPSWPLLAQQKHSPAQCGNDCALSSASLVDCAEGKYKFNKIITLAVVYTCSHVYLTCLENI